MAERLIDFKKPRQKRWGVLEGRTLKEFNYGNETDEKGNVINSYSTGCYKYAQDAVYELLGKGTSMKDIQLVELVPYDYVIKPNR